MTWFDKFPQLNDGFLRDLKKVIDDGFRSFTRSYGDAIESLFEPLRLDNLTLENRIIGTKSRGVYEAPGMTLLGAGVERGGRGSR